MLQDVNKTKNRNRIWNRTVHQTNNGFNEIRNRIIRQQKWPYKKAISIQNGDSQHRKTPNDGHRHTPPYHNMTGYVQSAHPLKRLSPHKITRTKRESLFGLDPPTHREKERDREMERVIDR